MKRQMASESEGKQRIFQNQEALVNLNLKTTIQRNKAINNSIPIAKNTIRFDMINSL